MRDVIRLSISEWEIAEIIRLLGASSSYDDEKSEMAARLQEELDECKRMFGEQAP